MQPDFSPTPSSVMTVRFQDCDPFNHLNNGRYIDYFLNAREDHLLTHYGFDIYGIARQTGLSWVVSTSQVAYLRPAFLMERVIIESRLIRFSGKHVEAEMRMWDEAKQVLKSLCWMSFVHYDLRQNKVAEHSAAYMELFQRIHAPVDEASFDERLRSLKRG
ncbi:MAG TPA: acyl-CoA thioesterase [Flavobacteriales bacterium]|nr:acyl-CoA thioesterase [Flavobacteriales bacterium]